MMDGKIIIQRRSPGRVQGIHDFAIFYLASTEPSKFIFPHPASKAKLPRHT